MDLSTSRVGNRLVSEVGGSIFCRQDMRVRVTIDKERCIGCGLCEENLPDLFAMGDFTAHVRTNPVDKSEELEATAGDCPTEAIGLSEVGGGQS